MLVKKAEMLPIECVVRGYLVGSGWKDYQATGTTSGAALLSYIPKIAGFVALVRVFGNVNYNGGLDSVTITRLGAAGEISHTDANGDFFFDAIDGSLLIMEAAVPSRPELIPMIRGVIAHDHIRPRVFYLLGPSDVTAASGLGLSFDPAKAIVEVDFRNAAIGGYGATLTRAGQVVTPGFGIVYDASGNPQAGQITATGGDGSTLLLGDLAPGDVAFGASVPAAATLPCQPRDAAPLPTMAGVVTWFDYECGTATD